MSNLSGFGLGNTPKAHDTTPGKVRDDKQPVTSRVNTNKDTVMTIDETDAKAAYKSATGATLPRPDEAGPCISSLTHSQITDIGCGTYSGCTRQLWSSKLGDFHIDGLGYGQINLVRSYEACETTAKGSAKIFDRTRVKFDLGGFDYNVMANRNTKLRIIAAPRGFVPDTSNTGKPCDAVIWPVHVMAKAPYTTVTPGEGTTHDQGNAWAEVAVDTDELRILADRGGISFYAEIETGKGEKQYINLDGIPGRNFEIPTAALDMVLPTPKITAEITTLKDCRVTATTSPVPAGSTDIFRFQIEIRDLRKFFKASPTIVAEITFKRQNADGKGTYDDTRTVTLAKIDNGVYEGLGDIWAASGGRIVPGSKPTFRLKPPSDVGNPNERDDNNGRGYTIDIGIN